MIYIRRLLDMTGDEVWSVWQTLGTWREIIHWTPFDWPPGYYLLLGGWSRLTGLHPITLRYLMLLIFMLGAAGLYRVAVRLFGERAGVPALLLFGAFGWSIFGSMHLRGHSLTLSLSPLVLWLTLRYFDVPQKWWRGVLLGVLLAALIYVHSTTAVYFVLLGVFTLIVYGWRAIWRWVLPGAVLGVLALPEILGKYALIISSRMSGVTYPRPPFVVGMTEFYESYWGRLGEVWLLLVILAVALVIWRGGRDKPRLLVALGLWCIMPLLFYATHEQLALFFPRYVLWYLTGFALLLAWGIAYLPAWGRAAVSVVLIGVLFTPMDIKNYDSFGENIGGAMAWLAGNMQRGDVIVIDPVLQREGHMRQEWDLFAQIFFPDGLPYAETPDGKPRVWYIRSTEADADTLAAVENGRVAQQFYGDITFFARLHEAPPNPDGVRFENGMRFHGAQIIHRGGILQRHLPMFHEDETTRVRLWWSVDAPLDLDYSVGVYVTNAAGAVVASTDSAPQTVNLSPLDDPPPDATSQWQPGELYVEEREITIPIDANALVLSVYQWWDGQRLAAPGADNDGLLLMTPIGVKAW